MSESVAIVIPARIGSIRVPDKNFRPCADGPSLLDRTIAFAQQLQLGPIVVTTDHLTWQHPAVVKFTRVATAECPERPMTAVLMELLPAIEAPVWLLLQPTSPFRCQLDINRAQARLGPLTDCAFSVKRLHAGGFQADGSVYLFRRKNLEQFGHLFGRTWSTFASHEPFGIDTPEEFAEAERRIRQRQS